MMDIGSPHSGLWSLSQTQSVLKHLTRKRTLFIALIISLALLFYASLQTYFQPQVLSPPLAPSRIYDSTNATEQQKTTSTTRILLVAAFFPLSKSKHSLGDYSYWQSQFLSFITTDVYFFTTPEMESVIRHLRGDLPITINATFSSPFDIPPLRGLQEQYTEMHEWDREKFRHSPELYAVWNGKPYFLDEAIKNARQEGKNYDYAFWNDAGSFRSNHRYREWPDLARVDKIWEEGSSRSGKPKEDLLFFPIYDVPSPTAKSWKDVMGPVDTEFSEGSFFGGSPQTITWWRELFYAYHDIYLSRQIFVGKDQTLINALFLLFPERVITVWYDDPRPHRIVSMTQQRHRPRSLRSFLTAQNCGSTWFYYQWWLASLTTRNEMAEYWMKHTSWWNWGGRCGLRNVQGMEEILTRAEVFAESWTPPNATLWHRNG